MLRQVTRRHLSTALIAAGLALLAWGLVSLLDQRPNAAEESALRRGEEISAGVTLPPANRAVEEDSTPTVAPPTPLTPLAPLVRPPAHSAPTRIVIPGIKLDAKVVEVGWKLVTRNGTTTTEWEVADYAAGFHRFSAYPGNPGNTVLSGHHNIKGEVFRYLVDLEPGDEIALYAEGRKYVYQVIDKLVVREAGASLEQRRKNAQWIAPTQDERLTLVTCWPYSSNTHRVIVIARPIPDNHGTPAESPPAPASQR
jgi:sortase A